MKRLVLPLMPPKEHWHPQGWRNLHRVSPGSAIEPWLYHTTVQKLCLCAYFLGRVILRLRLRFRYVLGTTMRNPPDLAAAVCDVCLSAQLRPLPAKHPEDGDHVVQ